MTKFTSPLIRPMAHGAGRWTVKTLPSFFVSSPDRAVLTLSSWPLLQVRTAIVKHQSVEGCSYAVLRETPSNRFSHTLIIPIVRDDDLATLQREFPGVFDNVSLVGPVKFESAWKYGAGLTCNYRRDRRLLARGVELVLENSDDYANRARVGGQIVARVGGVNKVLAKTLFDEELEPAAARASADAWASTLSDLPRICWFEEHVTAGVGVVL